MSFIKLTIESTSLEERWTNTNHILWFQDAHRTDGIFCDVKLTDGKKLSVKGSAADIAEMIDGAAATGA